MPFYIAILAATFGKGSRRPVLAALIRLAVLLAAAASLGRLISHGLGNAPHLRALPFWQIAPYAAFTVEVIVVFGLLSTVGTWQTKSNLRILMQCWPLTTSQQIAAGLLPYAVVVGITLALSLPILSTVFTALGLNAVGLLLCTLFGIGAAGGIFAVIAIRIWLGAFLTPIIIWTQYQTLTHLQNSTYATSTRGRYSLLFWVTTSLLLLLIPLLFRVKAATGATRIIRMTRFRLPYLFRKALRARSTRISAVTTLLISVGVAYVMHRRAVATWQLPFSVGAILLATLAADLRSLTLRYNPVEIVNVRGTARFVQWQFATAISATLCVSPLLLLAISYSSASQALLVCSETFFAISIGLFAGTLIVPEPGDISSQCLTALLCVGAFSVPLLTQLGAWSASSQAVVYTMAATIITSVACLTEYQRNPYIWRKTYETKQ